MIDVSQWRASIGLWKNCQSQTAAKILTSSMDTSAGSASEYEHQAIKRPAYEDSKSDSRFIDLLQEEKGSTLLAALFIAFIVIYSHFLYLFNHKK